MFKKPPEKTSHSSGDPVFTHRPEVINLDDDWVQILDSRIHQLFIFFNYIWRAGFPSLVLPSKLTCSIGIYCFSKALLVISAIEMALGILVYSPIILTVIALCSSSSHLPLRSPRRPDFALMVESTWVVRSMIGMETGLKAIYGFLFAASYCFSLCFSSYFWRAFSFFFCFLLDTWIILANQTIL